MPTEIRPLNAPLGACVRGTRLKGNYYPNDFQTIQQALLDHHLLLFPDQDITEAEQVGFSGLFGELEIHPSKEHRSSVQQEIYRRVSKVRVRVEHSSAGVKVFRSVRDIYRNFKAGFEDTLIETALRTAQSQERLPHRSMAQGGMNPETEMEKFRADSRAYLR